MSKKNVQKKDDTGSFSSEVNQIINNEKNQREITYRRKHTKVDKHKEKGKNKIRLRDERAQY